MALRSGESFLASLDDGRRVVLGGEVVENVATAPAFRRQAAAFAQFYDFQSHPQTLELMTWADGSGERFGMGFLEPRSKDDLRRRAAAYAAWAEVSCGLLARSPDYMNTMLTELAGLGGGAGSAARSGDRVRAIYDRARREDAFWTHTFIYPFQNHGPDAPNRAALRVVRRSSDGIWVSGARGIATAAPFANMTLNHEPVRPPRPGESPTPETPFAMTFALPVATPGLSWVCRDVAVDGRSPFDAPLAGIADELDAVAVLEEVFVPHEHLISSVEDFAAMADVHQFFSDMRERLTFHQSLIRATAKARFLFGLAHMLAESSGANQFINIKQRLGDFVLTIDLLEALAIAAVEDAERHPRTDWYMPNLRFASAGIRLFGEACPRLVEHITMIGGSRFVSTPQEETLAVMGERLERFLGPSPERARDQVELHRLAWEVAGSAFGARQSLYERFFAGGYEMRRAASYVTFDKAAIVDMVTRMMRAHASPEPFPVPARYLHRPTGGS